jgi:cell division protein FtsL
MENISILNLPTSIIRIVPLRLRFSFKLFWIIFITLIITLPIFYIFQVNDLTSKTYQIRDSQKKINELFSENEGLEIKLSKLNSLVNIETLIKKFNFEKADRIHYIQISESQIVKE